MYQARRECCNIEHRSLLTIDVEAFCHWNGEEHGKDGEEKCYEKLNHQWRHFGGVDIQYSILPPSLVVLLSPLLPHSSLPSHNYSLKLVTVGSCRTSLFVGHIHNPMCSSALQARWARSLSIHQCAQVLTCCGGAIVLMMKIVWNFC